MVRLPDEDEQVVVTRNEGAHRWEAHVGGVLAGFAAYRQSERLVVFTHTEVDPAFGGRGVGDALARHALDEVAAEGTRRVRPVCPFIRAWIDRHPDYAGLVRDAPTATTGTPDPPTP